MKKNYFLRVLLAAGLSGSLAYAQLPSGSIAPDFTLTDINGNTHHLYDYLNAGKTVIMDVSATWCGPCWNYHNSHALRDLWNAHGPTGTASNDVVVLFIEGDLSTTLADLNGTGGNTQGNWVTGTPYPIINATTNVIDQGYNINYFPTIYKICPNRILEEVGGQTAATLYSYVGDCPVPTAASDLLTLGSVGDKIICNGVANYAASFQNLSTTTPITSATLDLLSGGNVIASTNWTGNLAPLDTAHVWVNNVAASGTVDLRLTMNGDVNVNNNTVTASVAIPVPVSTASVTVEVKTDNYPGETAWKMYELGNPVAISSSPSYSLTNHVYTKVVNLSPNKCYSFVITDEASDGICCSYGQGYYKIKDATGAVVINATGNFGAEETQGLASTGSVDVEPEVNTDLRLYPNPATNLLNVELPSSGAFTISIVNNLGQVLKTVSGTGAEYQLSLDNLAQGAYLLNVVSEGQSMTQRFVKE